ncbi:hypothetical protein ACEPAF_4309 [Sanghuangporus sanghuang]
MAWYKFVYRMSPYRDEVVAPSPATFEPAKSPKRETAERVGTRELAARAATVSVDFHAVSEDDPVAGGNIPESQILDQISVLNSNFRETEISFMLDEITRTVNGN